MVGLERRVIISDSQKPKVAKHTVGQNGLTPKEIFSSTNTTALTFRGSGVQCSILLREALRDKGMTEARRAEIEKELGLLENKTGTYNMPPGVVREQFFNIVKERNEFIARKNPGPIRTDKDQKA